MIITSASNSSAGKNMKDIENSKKARRSGKNKNGRRRRRNTKPKTNNLYKIQLEGRNEQSAHRNERRGKNSRNNSNQGTKNRHEGSSRQKPNLPNNQQTTKNTNKKACPVDPPMVQRMEEKLHEGQRLLEESTVQ